jgi:uncharacterized membrane protein YfcA
VLDPLTLSLAIAAGSLVGLVLGLIGGGGSVLAVPLLVYAVGVPSPHVAIGTSALAVSLSAAANLVAHARAGRVKWPCAAVFTVIGMLGAYGGSTIAKAVNGQNLLVLFGMVMIAIGIAMLRRRGAVGDPAVRLTRASAPRMLPPLLGAGLGVGLLSGFFGIGGGFLVVPALVVATGMPLTFAIGTSLVSVTAFGATTAASYAWSGLIDLPLAASFLAGGLAGGAGGFLLSKRLAGRTRTLGLIFGCVVIVVGLYVVARGVMTLTGHG